VSELTRGDLRLQFEVVRGPAERVPLLFLHGLLASSKIWSEVIGELSGSRPIASLDLRGHGRSASVPGEPLDWKLAALAEDVIILLDELGWERAHVVGQSFGALLALQAAAGQPSHFASLVLTSVSADPEPLELRRRKLKTLELLERVGPEPLAQSAVLGMFGRTTRRERPELVASFLETAQKLDRRAFSAVARAGIERSDLGPITSMIRCPCLVVRGAEDELIAEPAAARLAQLLAADLVAIPGAGHLVPLEKPEPFARALAGFFRQIDRS